MRDSPIMKIDRFMDVNPSPTDGDDGRREPSCCWNTRSRHDLINDVPRYENATINVRIQQLGGYPTQMVSFGAKKNGENLVGPKLSYSFAIRLIRGTLVDIVLSSIIN